MRFLFKDYTDLILKAYEEQRKAGQLSRLLMHPTTVNIKQACLNVYFERIQKGEVEKNTLESFFSVPPAGKNLDYVIERCKPDKFRPLQSLIKGEIKNPNLINVELLAWLIDFRPRPWVLAERLLNVNGDGDCSSALKNGMDGDTRPGSASIDLTGEKVTPSSDGTLDSSIYASDYNVSNPGLDNDVVKHKPTSIVKRRQGDSKLKKIAFTSLTVVILIGVIYWVRKGFTGEETDLNNTSCMYWADDHYEQVPCSDEREGRMLLPMNEERMNHFKRIMQPDTITEWSIGKIYYIKRNKVIEYYTKGGNHPVETIRSLRKLSRYMFDKYLNKKLMSNDKLVSGEDAKFSNNH